MKKNKTVLITGASMGIGLEFAYVFAKNGFDLYLVARSADKLKALASEIEAKYQVNCHVQALNLTLPNAAEEVFKACKAQHIEIEILVNNAGLGEFGFFAETDWEKEKQILDLNMLTLTHFTKLFLKEMVQRKSGKILNVASTAAFQPGPTMAVYYASKAYVLSFSEAISNELEGSGVTVTCLCPGPTASNFQNTANLGESKLVKGRKLPGSKEVAEYGYQALMQGEVVAIHGFMNAFMAFLTRFTPRFLVRKLVRQVQDKAQ